VTTQPVRYSERLWPSAWVWAVVLLVAASGGLVVVRVAPLWVSVVVAVACVALAAWGLTRSSSRVAVVGDDLVAGRARIPVTLLGAPRVVERAEFLRLRGPGADVRAYLCQRGWIPQGVQVDVADPQDPTPYWLVSSRRPRRLAAALVEARGESAADGSADAATPSEMVAGGDASRQAHSRQTG
jgi:hypothetical protein